MANFYTDNPNIKFYLTHPLIKHIVELKERNFADKDKYDYAPENFEDAMDNYERVLELAGDVMANVVAPNAEAVDAEGPHLENNRMIYASKTYENLDATIKAGLNGVTMPRRYGGLNFPMVVYGAINEMVATADTGFENIWSLQDCIETLYEFGNEDQRQRYVPRVCEGQTMSMDLTEPDAGSDLQSVMLKATYDEKEDCWRSSDLKMQGPRHSGVIAILQSLFLWASAAGYNAVLRPVPPGIESCASMLLALAYSRSASAHYASIGRSPGRNFFR